MLLQYYEQLKAHLSKVERIKFNCRVDEEGRVLWNEGVRITLYWGDTFIFHYSESLLKMFPADDPNWMVNHIKSLGD